VKRDNITHFEIIMPTTPAQINIVSAIVLNSLFAQSAMHMDMHPCTSRSQVSLVGHDHSSFKHINIVGRWNYYMYSFL